MGNEEKFANIFPQGGGDNGGGIPQMGMMPGGMTIMMVDPNSMPGGFGQKMITGDDVAFNESPDDKKIHVPQGFEPDHGIRIFEQMKQDLEEPVTMDRVFLFRPDDGAVATDRVLRRKFGQTFGKGTMFSYAKSRTVKIGVDETVQVKWGNVEIPTLEGAEIMLCDRHPHKEYGQVFEIHALLPKKFQRFINELFDEIEQELRTNSIYRGKVLQGAETLEFKNMSSFDPDKYVFATNLMASLEGTLWSALRYTEQMKADGESVKRAVLAHGEFGTGKSTLGLITAMIAFQNGWTTIFARPGRDDIQDVLRTAKLYGKTVVIYEDIDKDTEGGNSVEVSELLEAFDGASSKDCEIVLFMTANHPEKIIKGMLRPGRIDGVFEVGALDRPAVEQLIRIKVSANKLAEVIDYDKIFVELEGYSPAFVNEAIKRTKSFAMTRAGGSLAYVLETEDFVRSAKSLRDQYEMLEAAHEGAKKPTLDSAFADSVRQAATEAAKDALHGSGVKYSDGDDAVYVLSVPGRNGQRPA